MDEITDPAVAPAADSAVRELARDEVQRKKFLRMAGRTIGSGAAASALAAFIAACGSSSSSSTGSSSSGGAGSGSAGGSTSGATGMGSTSTSSSSGDNDLAIVNYALTLEYLESQFYDKVVSSGLFKGSVLSTLKRFGHEEHEHVAALKSVAMKLGTPASAPTGKFPLTSAAQVAKLAGTVENLGAAAYLGQASAIKSKEILAAALSIHSVEARHAATLNTVLKLSPTPDGAFAKPMGMAEVLKAIKPFIA